MTLPASGQISLSQVNTELGKASNANITMNDAAVRSLFGVASGAISMSNGWGKSSSFAATITTNQTNLNLRTWAISAGWNGTSPVTITINSGVYVYSTSTGTPALTIDGSWPGGVSLINNGNIIGMGGDGGQESNGGAGGNAISLGTPITISNNAYIAGGGGGGGGAKACSVNGCGSGYQIAAGGGGAGGGSGKTSINTVDGEYSAAGGAGGGLGSQGGNGTYASDMFTGMFGSGGGGRTLPGTGGAGAVATNSSVANGGGSGGGGGCGTDYGLWGGPAGGGGGGWGAAGGTGYQRQYHPQTSAAAVGGTGGSANNAGGNGSVGEGSAQFTGGAGGKAVALNGYTVTWIANGTRYGAIN